MAVDTLVVVVDTRRCVRLQLLIMRQVPASAAPTHLCSPAAMHLDCHTLHGKLQLCGCQQHYKQAYGSCLWCRRCAPLPMLPFTCPICLLLSSWCRALLALKAPPAVCLAGWVPGSMHAALSAQVVLSWFHLLDMQEEPRQMQLASVVECSSLHFTHKWNQARLAA